MKDKCIIALLGNPNSGKTTLFNLLTKNGEAVGNRAGVTFSAKKAHVSRFTKKKNVFVIDLPGVYSLSAATDEEIATRNVLTHERIHVLLNIVDATNLERGLFLTLALLRLGIPTVMALSMMDEAERMKIHIDTKSLSRALGVQVFPITAIHKHGIEALLQGCLQVKSPPVPIPYDNHSRANEIIHCILASSVKAPDRSPSFSRIDALLCHPMIGIPFFFIVMSLIFFITFSSIGAFLSRMLTNVFLQLAESGKWILHQFGVSAFLSQFLIDGIGMGVASILSFTPQTAIFFCLFVFLDDCGYLARAVFVMDACMRRIHISGKAILPAMIGFGCTVPAIKEAATLHGNEKKRVVAALPFIPCNARIPLALAMASSLFQEHAVSFCVVLYALCLFAAILSSLLFETHKASPTPILTELPKYRLPQPITLFREVKNKIKDQLRRAMSVVLLACVCINLIAYLIPPLIATSAKNGDAISDLWKSLLPVFSFFGFGDARLVPVLLSGLFAKEAIVSAIHLLIPEGLSHVLSPAAGMAFSLYSLLYSPCISTYFAMRRELGKKTAMYVFIRTSLIASAFSYFFYTLIIFYQNHQIFH